MGGKSSSSSSSSSSTNVEDRRVAATDSAIVATEGSTIYTSDAGAIDAAKEIGLQALTSNEAIAFEAVKNASTLSSGALSAIGANADKAFEFVDKQRQDEEERTARSITPWILASASAVAIAAVYWGSK